LPSGARVGVCGCLGASIGCGNGCLHNGIDGRGGCSLGAKVGSGGDGECCLDVDVRGGDSISLGLSLLKENCHHEKSACAWAAIDRQSPMPCPSVSHFFSFLILPILHPKLVAF